MPTLYRTNPHTGTDPHVLGHLQRIETRGRGLLGTAIVTIPALIVILASALIALPTPDVAEYAPAALEAAV